MGLSIDKKSMSEAEVRDTLITPALNHAQWKTGENMRLEYFFTDGEVIVQGSKHARKSKKFADYLLYVDSVEFPIAVVEAKDNKHAIGAGLQQAMDYAQTLDLPFAYSSNGDGFVEHDFTTGEEREIKLDEFPTPQQLRDRLLQHKQLTPAQQAVVSQPYYTDSDSFEPRYYQRIAINRTVEHIARGNRRALLVMATGTGKTLTAFQIIYRLRAAMKLRKVLFLADRNILIDQTMRQDFKPFGKTMTKVSDKDIDSSFEVYMALYQQLVSNDETKPDPFTKVTRDFFDLIVIDECHRGSAKLDSQWRKVLDYFSGAVQIGMTATPKTDKYANNLAYFGDPVYTYKLSDGIRDGFLAPYRVTNVVMDIDLNGWNPTANEVDDFNQLIEQRQYVRNDFGRSITFTKRQAVVAVRINQMLHKIGRMTKTIVFCPDVDEADTMRLLLSQLNPDMMRMDSRYVMRIVGEDGPGKAQLDNFIDPNEPYPTVVTTSILLSTGVDCKTCGLIVIDKEIGSMTDFKQIVGRGTRLNPKHGKMHLEILDFRNVTSKFRDPAFDGDPIPPDDAATLPPKPNGNDGDDDGPSGDGTSKPQHKYRVSGQDVSIVGETVQFLGEDGQLHYESVTDYSRKQILKLFPTVEDFRSEWIGVNRKQLIVNELADKQHVIIDAVRDLNPALSGCDIFDVICHVAYDQPHLTRRERVNQVKKRDYLSRYQGKAREIMEAVMERYATTGILEIEDPELLKTPPFDSYGSPARINRSIMGGDFNRALRELEIELYRPTA